MRFLLLFAVLSAMSGLFYTCTCEEEFPVDPLTFDLPLQVTNANFDQILVISFNKPVDTTTVIPDKTLFIRQAKFTGYHTWSAGKTTLFIEGCEIYDLTVPINNTNPYPFQLFLDGNLSDGAAIRGTDGSVLDGDKDNTAGGDFLFDSKKNNCSGIYTLAVTNYLNGTFTSFRFPADVNKDNSYFFDIRFSQPLDPATAVYGDAIFLEIIPGNQRIPGKLAVRNRNTLRFVSDDQYTKIRLPPGSNSNYRFVIKSGNVTTALKSVYGATLSSDFILNIRLE